MLPLPSFPPLPALPDVLDPSFGDFLYSLSVGAQRIVYSFSFLGNYFSTPWSILISLLSPSVYNSLVAFENSVLRFVPTYSLWLWIFSVDSLLDLTFLHAVSFGVFFVLVYKFFTWVLNLVT